MSNSFTSNTTLLNICGKTIGNEKDLSVQIGINIEEFCELLERIEINRSCEYLQLTAAAEFLREVSTQIKEGFVTASLKG